MKRLIIKPVLILIMMLPSLFVTGQSKYLGVRITQPDVDKCIAHNLQDPGNIQQLGEIIQKASLFPNPNTGCFTINIETAIVVDSYIVEAYNNIGIQVYSYEYPCDGTVLTEELCLPNPVPGISYIIIKTRDFQIMKKIIIQ